MRGYPPSDSGDNLYRVGLAVDVLNLIALLKEQTNQPGPLENTDTTRIGLWGISLGGGVALRVATVSEDITAVLLYSSISGDEFKNAEFFYEITESHSNLAEIETPPDIMTYISPINYFDRITASVKLYHGSLDEAIPSTWAAETCDAMEANNIDIDCIYYLNCGHTAFSKCQPGFNDEVLAFFDSRLMEP
jgi:dipeptidyl aminopeptidase/acylaminoacyl peptidase